MRGGEILVHGDAGDQAGAGLRRGLIAVAGRVGDVAGLRMLAGTIVALGRLGAAPGAGMRRGTIVAMSDGDAAAHLRLRVLVPPALPAPLSAPPARLGPPVADEQIEGRYARWSGDGLELMRGEILILEAGQ